MGTFLSKRAGGITMATNAVAPEIVAAITAAVQTAAGGKVVAVRIKPAEVWTLANRSNL